MLLSTGLLWSALPSLSRSENPVQFDSARAWSHLLKQCSFGPRDPGSMGYRQCLQYLESELRKTTPDVLRQAFMENDPATGKPLALTNLIARFYPERTTRIVLCAHWDTRPWADQDADSSKRRQPILGANDGASGVAVLLEVARCISLLKPLIGVDIVLFDGEDSGREGKLDEYCLGSRWYSQNLDYRLPEAAVLLDMIGGVDQHIPIEQHSQLYAGDLVKEVYDIAARLGVPSFLQTSGRPVYDDHLHLIEMGIPAIDLIDFDYPYWHTTHDTPEHCSQKSLDNVGRVVFEWVKMRGR